jgi:hypothetical protein
LMLNNKGLLVSGSSPVTISTCAATAIRLRRPTYPRSKWAAEQRRIPIVAIRVCMESVDQRDCHAI